MANILLHAAPAARRLARPELSLTRGHGPASADTGWAPGQVAAQ